MNFPHGETAAQELGACLVSTVSKISPVSQSDIFAW